MNKDTCIVYVGYDSTQSIAYDVLEWSIKKHAKRPVEVRPIKLSEMIEKHGFNRALDPLQSTEFTYTRFLVPHLMNYEGIVLFMDSDMLALGDVTELFDLSMTDLALRVVKHDHQPKETTKMGGKTQTAYPRKNWSSLMLMNCAKLKCWSKEAVETQSGAWLHRFEPISDRLIGEIDGDVWNTLDWRDDFTELIHYTTGGPWLPGCERHPYGDIWRSYKKGLYREKLGRVFSFGGVERPYFCHPLNMTWKNERAIELPIVHDFLKAYDKRAYNVLELGDVLGQYGNCDIKRTIVDKGATRTSVVREDILDYSGGPFDAIVSISTLEHVGLEDETNDLSRAITAVKKCCSLLKPNGRLLFTVPVGFNKVLDAWLMSGWAGKSKYLMRISLEGDWIEVPREVVDSSVYGKPYQSANALIVGEYTNQ